MTSPVTRRSPATRSLSAALIALAASAALLGTVELSLFPASRHPLWALDLFPVGGLVYAAAGLMAGGGGRATGLA